MRYGIISDIHANLEALEATLRLLESYQVDQVICLGDVVGYGADPEACCDLVRRTATYTILGNHDAAVAERMDYTFYRLAARKALDGHRQLLSEQSLEWLKELPYIAHQKDASFCHASPVDYSAFKYVFGVEHMEPLIESYQEQPFVTFIGHSHLCKCFFYNEHYAEEILNTRFHLVPGYRYVITVGSVGQPRDHDPRACCGVYDTSSQEFEYLRVPYQVSQAAHKIFNVPYLSDTFGHRLFLGV
jgi:diadenosine tetraphosphatase ApaH/serine/threonine PP2A family protein phosphatase